MKQGLLVWLCPLTAPVPPWGAACCAWMSCSDCPPRHPVAWHTARLGELRAQQAGQPQLPPLTPVQRCWRWINVPPQVQEWQLRADEVIATNHLDLSWLVGVERTHFLQTHTPECTNCACAQNLWTRLQGQSLLEKFSWIYWLIPKEQNKTISCWFRPLYYFKKQPDHSFNKVVLDFTSW